MLEGGNGALFPNPLADGDAAVVWAAKAEAREPPLTTIIMSRSARSFVAAQSAWFIALRARARLDCTGATLSGDISTANLGPLK